ncbi:MAG: monovalent cation/H+ antiporter subunit D [Roseovarius sp.]|nr:monovalent cation/H+ antiporter subunit D [Roseovarius sp.]
MSHWIIAPVVLPAVLAALLTLSMRYRPTLQRVFSVAGTSIVLAITLALMAQAATGAIEIYELGNWPAPFGIVLVLDRLSALMVALTAALALVVLLYAIGTGWDQRGRNFHALFQFQLMGIFGAFLTGDAFNLFVFFEVLLIASYGLMIHAGGRRRFKAGVQYVIYNLLGSTLFLFALGTLYAVTGTLNMADLALRAAEIQIEDSALLRVGAMLLFLVFAIKAALLPLHFWLPETYAEAPAPVAALFAVMTKVGAYAVLRFYTLVFGPDLGATADLIDQLLLYGALLTLAVGMIGILGAKRLGRLAAFAAIGSMGTVMIAMSGFTPATTSATIYYMIHSTLAGALLFLVVDLVRERRGEIAGALRPGPQMPQHGMITALFFATAIATAGLPPLSGFIGKLLVLDAVREMPQVWLIWTVILTTSLVAVLGFVQAGSVIFWKTEAPNPTPTEADPRAEPSSHSALSMVACFALLAGIVALAVFAGPVMGYVYATAGQLHDPNDYITAVLGQR